ncbi:hypothetical protein ACJMK2_012973 [Sinanodonta woodiana]|uniref:HAT C-terminal dimerisation domain-containing protein n=1 Tax=Sinanodonta woodiana TaxID=1069815 RepID=A0ABD3VCX1_SINWO
MRQELDNRTQDKDLALLGCLLNRTMKDLEFLPDSGRAYGHALLLKVALDMADVKVNVQVEPVTSDEQPSDSLPPQRIAPSLLNFRDDNTKTINVDKDDWLQDVVCLGESQQPITDVIHQKVSRYLLAAPYDTNLTMLQRWKQNCQLYPHLSLLAQKYLSIICIQ